MLVDRFPAITKGLQKRTESVCHVGQITTNGGAQRKSFHQLDRQLHMFRNLSRKKNPSILFKHSIEGPLNADLRSCSTLALLGYFSLCSPGSAQLSRRFQSDCSTHSCPFDKLQLCSSLNLSVLAPKNWPFLNGKSTTQVESSLPSVETLFWGNALSLRTRFRARFVA